MSGVIHKEQEESRIVLDYQPKKIQALARTEAHNFVSLQQAQSNSFRMSDLVAQQTGVQELEKASLEKRIEQKALERLNEIQESAYQEAYNLGLEEGMQKGYEEAKQVITQRLGAINVMIEKLTRIKTDILQRNEIQIVDLVYMLASKVAVFEIEKNVDRIVPVLRSAMESLQKDESITVKVHPDDLAVIDALKEKSDQEFEFLNTARLEQHDNITRGGCVVETNYGLIDATVEERLTKLWESLASAKPSVKRDEFE